MACEQEQNQELIHKANISMTHTKDPLKLIQAKILGRGAAGFKQLQKRFLIMDNDRSHTIDYDEFKYGMADIGVHLEENKMHEVFKIFDKDGSNAINMTEFVVALQPQMNAMRSKIVKTCFMLMDRSGDGEITVKDLIGNYDVSKNRKYLSGDWTEAKVYREFLNTFQPGQDPDEKITLDEFMSYYASLSASIDKDAYFLLMMQNSWKPLDKQGKFFM